MNELESIETENIAQTIAKQVQKPTAVAERDNISVIAMPAGWTVKSEDFEHLLPAPRRKKATVSMSDTESFVGYVSAHKIDQLSTIYCSADYIQGNVTFTAVLKDHSAQPDGQQWRDHQARYHPEKSVEWIRWIGNNSKHLNQTQFAAFVEDNLEDIAAVEGMPTRGELLQMVLNFEATQDSRFKQHARLQSGGIELNYINKDDEQTIQKMRMFEKISIGIPVFDGDTDNYRLDARLRYRVREGTLTFWYELIRPDKVLEAAAKQMIDTIKTSTGIPFYFGDPNL
jgi:uncharacterized protein YfdQ (DUF2303 family)